jgi:expansin (peptidoglycan-binding protein)
LLRPLLRSALVVVGLLGLLALPACSDDPPLVDDDSSNDFAGETTHSGSSTVLSSEQTKGIATFYDYSGAGEVACSFDIGSNTDVAAINTTGYAESASCGSCLDVSGPKGKITLRIVDQCPGCAENHLDLSAQAFAKIADPKAGRVPITYQLVSCPVKGNMSYRIKEGSSKWWTAIQVRNHKLPIAKVEYEKKGVFTAMKREDYNYFVDTSGVGDQPRGIAIRITATDGQVVQDIVPRVQEGAVFAGKVQFR